MQSQIERGTQSSIILPEGMEHSEAIARLKADKELQTYGEKEVTIEEVIHRFPFEAAYALSKAATELHGATIGHDIVRSDGTVIKNKLIGVPISTTENVQVPWGPFHLPDVEGEFETLQAEDNGAIVMKLVARVKRKYQEKVVKLAERTRQIADAESIYRGKAVMVQFRNNDGDLDIVPPVFMDLSGEHTVIFSDEVMREIQINILVPITRAELAKKLNIPTKRGVLLYGTYGSGKTLTARWMAKEATKMGRTFIYVKNAAELGDAVRFASLYGPALIFGEDIDRAMDGSRTAKMDAVLNTVDGVDTKNLDVITVLTTNNLETIHPAFLREGRMDTIIEIDRPDAGAIEALVRHFGGDLIDPSERLTRLVNHLVGRTPAFIREVVERCKLEKIFDLPDDETTIRLTGQDLELACHLHVKEREKVEMLNDDEHLINRLGSLLQERGLKIQVVR